MNTASDWIAKLRLARHPEGGWFRETYRSADEIKECCLGDRFAGKRSVSTSIYFLLESGQCSALHRIRSDEVWHHYDGSALTIHVIDPAGEYRSRLLGKQIDRGEEPQLVVPAGCWFGATVNEENSFALVGCTVAPGFDFRDFELGQREELLRLHPRQHAVIERLTR